MTKRRLPKGCRAKSTTMAEARRATPLNKYRVGGWDTIVSHGGERRQSALSLLRDASLRGKFGPKCGTDCPYMLLRAQCARANLDVVGVRIALSYSSS